MAEATGRRSVQLGQFRLTRLQVVNWGTFCGYKDLHIDERGVLFTGPSGSGKSSLLDAHSVALLPARDQRFNASADLTAKGAKQSTRSTADYVRGAWSENDDEHGQSQVRYLRGGKPTWSAVGVTYDDGLESVTTGVVVRWFTGTETDGAHLKTMHQFHDGHFDLTALEEWAQKGFDLRWLKAAFPSPLTAYPASETEYVRSLAKRVGLGTSRMALSLLGKAKAMKNVGDLNMFIRENMLDEPKTFAAARTMTELFEPLNDAYQRAQRAYEQRQVLSPVPGNWTAYCKAREESSLAATLQGMPADYYLRGLHIGLLEEETSSLEVAIKNRTTQLQDETQRASQAKGTFQSLAEQLRREGRELTGLEEELSRAEAQHQTRQNAYLIFSGHVQRLGMPLPEDLEAFAALRDTLPAVLESARSQQEEIKPKRRDATHRAGEAVSKHRERSAELTVLERSGSLIPLKAVERREAIARGADVPAAELAYAAELIDLAQGQERWRPAAEKVLRNYGLRLLVPERHKDAVRAFIDEHDMRGIVEYSIVTATSAHQPRPGPHTLAGKLTVETGHPSGAWLAGQLAKLFEHVCVETAQELEGYPLAVTVRGTVKMRGNHYRKDDRSELTNPSSYILGANTAAKRAALQAEVDSLHAARQGAETEADDLDRQWQALSSRIDSATQLAAYTSWSDLDHWAPARTAQDLEERINQIKTGNVNLRLLQEKCDAAEKAWERLIGVCGESERAIASMAQRKEQLAGDYEREIKKPHEVEDDAKAYLDEVYASLGTPGSADTMPQLRQAFSRELDRRRRDADQERQVTAAKIKGAIDVFLTRWPDTAPDNSGDVDRTGADFAALHEEISQRKLPEAMSRFRKMISEDMIPSVSVLYRTIETATAEIRRRVDVVNLGLQRIEFNHGTHLQITCNARKFESAKEFRHIVDELLRHAPAARSNQREALTQFTRVRDLMKRFTGQEPESKRWSETVLDVRLAFTFYGREEDAEGVTVHTYRNTAAGSGGEQEKLVAFCLAAALSYNLADDRSGGRPRFAALMLDEAFSKSDETYASQALAAFDEFGFQLLMAAPIRMSGVLEPFIGQAVLVEKRATPEGSRSNAASATFGELAVRREAETDGKIHAAA
jgi:uncharacterized protein YPO0396